MKSIFDTTGAVPTSLETASEIFTRGGYQNSLQVEVTNNRLQVGVKKTVGETPAENWTVFDNFELYYLGNDNTGIDISESKTSDTTTEAYDLAGRRVPLSSKGVLILKGKQSNAQKVVRP